MTEATIASPQQRSQKIMSHNEALGMMEGLAIGDALGAYLEFSDRREPDNYLREYKEGGPHQLKAGYGTDDLNMAKAIADGALQLLVSKKNEAGFFRLGSYERSAFSIYAPLVSICSRSASRSMKSP